MKIPYLAAAAVGLISSMTCMSTAHAAFIMVLDDTSTVGLLDVILSDDQLAGFGTGLGFTTVDDAFAGLGTMSYLGAVGNFNVNVTTGTSKPALGGGVMGLNSVDISDGAGGELDIFLVDTGFSGTYPGYTGNYSGLTTGIVEFAFWYDALNGGFGGAEGMATGPISGPSFSGSAAFPITSTATYALTIHANINHGTGTQSTSLSANLTPVPVPAALWLFGSGLLGLVGMARRKKV